MKIEIYYECPICHSSWPTRSAAIACRNQHPIIEKRWANCEVCGQAHIPVTGYVCPHCTSREQENNTFQEDKHMANRSLLHRSKIEDFKNWLKEDGWKIEQPKGIYEVVRATKGTRKPLIVYTRDNKGNEHITVQDRDVPVVRAYIRDRRREARAKANGIQKVTQEEMLKIIETRKPLGKFYRIEGKTIIAVDNSTGDAWTEEFKNFEVFLLWITTQLTVEEAEEIIKGRGNKCATECVGIRN
jgi:hypothetical protein